MQPTQQGTLSSWERWHLLKDGLKKSVLVLTGNNRKVFTCSLLKLRVENVSITFKDDNELILDLGKEICPVNKDEDVGLN